MSKRVLVAYATTADSTRDVAEFIGKVLRQHGFDVDVRNVKKIPDSDLSVYDGVVLGSGVRLGRLMPGVLDFARKFWRDLERVPTAYFVVCMTVIGDTRAHRTTAREYLRPLRDIHEPEATGLFAGRIDRERLSRPWRFMLNFTSVAEVGDADYRDWQAIRAWAEGLVPLLEAEAVR